MPKLQVAIPDGTTASHDLTDETITLGRVADNMIQIDDASVSSHHAELSFENDAWHIVDKGSSNGTLLNDRAVKSARLTDGDVVQIAPGEQRANHIQAGRAGVEDNRIPRIDQARPGLADALLHLGVDGHPRAERELVGGAAAEHRAAAGAGQKAFRGQGVEILADSNL